MSAFRKLVVNAVRKTMQNAPAIYAGIAAACAIGSAYGFVKATLKSREALTEREDQLAELEAKFEEDPSIDTEAQKQMRREINWKCAKKVAPNFILPVFTTICELVSIRQCHKGHKQQKAIMAGAFNVFADQGSKIIEKAGEEVGKKKIETIKDEASIDKLKEVARSNPKIIETGHGSEIFIHEPTGQVFRSGMPHVMAGINAVDNKLSSGEEDYVVMDWLMEYWGANESGFGKLAGFPAEKFRKPMGLPLYDQVKIRSWDNPDTGEVWKMICHPWELYSDGSYISVPAY